MYLIAVGVGSPATTSRTHGLAPALRTSILAPASTPVSLCRSATVLASSLELIDWCCFYFVGLHWCRRHSWHWACKFDRGQGKISQKVVSVSFEPTTSTSVTNGELTFGGTDTTKHTGSIAYTPLTTTTTASSYWGINESITYGSATLLSSTAGIVDTGTTLIYIASDAYSKYQSATGATLDGVTGLLSISSTQYNALKNLSFKIGSGTYTLTPNAQIWPRSLNSYLGGSSTAIYLVVTDIGSASGSGLDFIDGYTFLERFYSVFDTDNSRVGFATTLYTDATTN
ncbi:aspartic peptidase domain-containing protein [Suillus bovinus]|uniref:aspartic peptidase domain-containing protein n=1 Tax=Suillus bovinus TaxID=48563 RepID=UPI001B86BF57|nr:aspartic peptidase domain-containing protein [Suillus bovinus]KAG2156568.1 aspartic peptidase domain-containing protein [Suillus bovinus]